LNVKKGHYQAFAQSIPCVTYPYPQLKPNTTPLYTLLAHPWFRGQHEKLYDNIELIQQVRVRPPDDLLQISSR